MRWPDGERYLRPPLSLVISLLLSLVSNLVFRLYLAGKPFILQTDHRPLPYINKTKYHNDRIMRWALTLQGYDYTVQDIPGKDNGAADYFSRVMN